MVIGAAEAVSDNNTKQMLAIATVPVTDCLLTVHRRSLQSVVIMREAIPVHVHHLIIACKWMIEYNQIKLTQLFCNPDHSILRSSELELAKIHIQ